jgi:hypothetical protein
MHLRIGPANNRGAGDGERTRVFTYAKSARHRHEQQSLRLAGGVSQRP